MKHRLAIIFLIAICLLSLSLLYFFEKGKNAKNDSSDEISNEEPADVWEKIKEEVIEKTEVTQDLLQDNSGKDASSKESDENQPEKYRLHENITTTIFWVGEKAGDDNDDISNSRSVWDDSWKKHFGGTDSPSKRNGFYPKGFVPKENPFYVALPYNDFGDNGKRKAEAANIIPWANKKKYRDNESMCKNRWLRIIKNSKVAYAQWEDAGPFGENDANYVFGSSLPKSQTNKNAGLDVSPAIKTYLGLGDIDKASWQFVDEDDVPDGPWKKIITVSQISWN